MNAVDNNKNGILFEEGQDSSMDDDGIKYDKDIYSAVNIDETDMTLTFDMANS